MDKNQVEIRDFVFNSLSGKEGTKIATADFAPLTHDKVSIEKRLGEIRQEGKLAEKMGFNILDLA